MMTQQIPSSILFCTETFRPEDQTFFEALYAHLSSNYLKLCITADQTLPSSHPMVIPSARQYGLLLQKLGARDLLTEDDLQSALDNARAWGSREAGWYTPEVLRALAVGFEFQIAVLRPTLILLWNKVRSAPFVLDLIAKKHGIRTLALERTPYPNLVSLDPEGSLCDSAIYKSARNHFVKGDWSHFEPSAVCAYERAQANAPSTWWSQPEQKNLPELRCKLKVPENAEVILFLGQVDRDVQNTRHNPFFSDNQHAFRSFLDALPDELPLFVIGKHHPMSEIPAEGYQRLIHPSKGVWTSDLNIHDAFALCHRVAAVNSAGAFEAALQGIPTTTLGRSMLSDFDVFYEWRCADDKSTVSNWLHATPIEAEGRRQRARQVLDYFLQQDFYYFAPTAPEDLKGPPELAQRLSCLATHSVQCASRTAPQLEDLQLLSAGLQALSDLNSSAIAKPAMKLERRLRRTLSRIASTLRPQDN